MKKGIKKYQIGADGLMVPRMGSVKTAEMPLVSGTPKQVSIPGQKDFSFTDKADAFMGKYGGAITQAAGTLMPLLMKKPDANAKPYKKGSKLIKYQEGVEDATLSPGLASTYAEAQAMKANVEDRRKAFLQKISNREKNTFDGKIDIALDPEVNAKFQRQFDIVRSSTGLTPNTKSSFNEVPVRQIKKFDYLTSEAKGGYARALKEGKRDKQGNLIDSKTNLIYKDLRKSSSVPKSNTPSIRTKNVETPRGTMTGDELVLMSKMGKDFNPYSAIGSNVPFSKPAKKETMINKDLVLESKRGKAFNPYTMAGFPNPIPRTEVKAPVQKKETAKVDNRRVYPEESPLAKYRKGIPSKPATNVPTRVMDYPTQNLLASQRGELANNMKAYGMRSPFNPNGSVNFYTPFFEMGHNARFGKKK